MWPGTLIAVLLAAALQAPVRVGDIPPVADMSSVRHAGPPLQRTHDLVRSFLEGEGVWRRSGVATSAGPVTIEPLSRPMAPGRKDGVALANWAGEKSSDGEGMLSIVLGDGESWCTKALSWPSGSRLRFDSIRVAGEPSVSATVTTAARSMDVARARASLPGPLSLETQRDLTLPGAGGSICLAAQGGSAALGEVRVVAPDPAPASKPRWVIVTVVDTLSADVLASASTSAPALRFFASQARVFRRALSPGSHTLASMLAIQSGRDQMRFDPAATLYRHVGMQMIPRASAEVMSSRPNLFLSQRLQDAGYHSVLFGNNAYLRGTTAYARYSIHGDPSTGTLDDVRLMPALLSRYADERLFLLLWISAPHTGSMVPRRLYESMGCAALPEPAQRLCAYRARVRHADEAFEAFQQGLARAGLTDATLEFLTADHGEQFEDGSALEHRPNGGRQAADWVRMDVLHGKTTDFSVVHVPLMLKGPGIKPGVWDGPVSTLDIAPTIGSRLGLPSLARSDGEPLPMTAPPAPAAGRRLVSSGFCSHSEFTGALRFVWWDGACGPRRAAGSSEIIQDGSEWWDGPRLVSTSRRPAAELREAQARHGQWVKDRLSREALILDFSGLPERPLRLTLRCPTGRIVDWGPSSTVSGLDRITMTRQSADEHTLVLETRGYRGRFAVITSPPRSDVVLEAQWSGEAPPVVFVGPRQLPLNALGGLLEPAKWPSLFVSATAPPARGSDRPYLRLWWQSWGGGSVDGSNDPSIAHIEQVLRAWGYIR